MLVFSSLILTNLFGQIEVLEDPLYRLDRICWKDRKIITGGISHPFRKFELYIFLLV
jgi:hypothetical protein